MTQQHHYKLVQELGRGASGVIHLALDVSSDRLVAVKHLSSQAVARHPNAVARFRREGRILTRLRHPHLVEAVRCGRFQGRPYIAMEYVAGEPLSDLIARGPLELRRALRVAERVARALDYVHQQGIVHRDVKPSNILVDRAFSPRLVDFGLARDESERDMGLTDSGIAVGTMRYSSPEQCGGASHRVSGAADIYALGLVLATSLTGVVPRVPRSMQDLEGRFERELERPLLRAGVPDDVIEVCRRATRSEPERRYRTALEMARALHGAVREASPSRRLSRADERLAG